MPTTIAAEGSCPWDTADLSFAGWVPTVLGHLAYSMVGIPHRWSQHRSFNDLDQSTGVRAVATHQRRTAQDFPIWDWVLRTVRPSTTQNYFLVAETKPSKIPFIEDKTSIRIVKDTQGVLSGTVYVVPWQDDTEIGWERDNLVNDLKILIDQKICAPNEICQRVSNRTHEAIEKNILVHNFRFALFRTGEIRIWSNIPDTLGRSIDVANITELDRALLNSLPKQVYYFIKDATHNHYHHESSSDQILPLVKMEQVKSIHDTEVHRSNEIKWRREVLWGLARVLARFRRENNIRQLKQAQGILAYADSFQSTVGRITRGIGINDDPKFDDDLTTYDFAHAKQSVTASEGLRTWQNAGNLQIIVGLLAIAFSAASFWATSSRIAEAACVAGHRNLKEECAEPISNRAVDASIWISSHPLVFVGLIIIPLTVFYSIFVKDIRTFDWSRKPAHFIGSLSQAIGASVSRKFEKPLLGFFVTILILLVLGVLSILSVVFAASSMHVR